jgi:hypothetical protein
MRSTRQPTGDDRIAGFSPGLSSVSDQVAQASPGQTSTPRRPPVRGGSGPARQRTHFESHWPVAAKLEHFPARPGTPTYTLRDPPARSDEACTVSRPSAHRSPRLARAPGVWPGAAGPAAARTGPARRIQSAPARHTRAGRPIRQSAPARPTRAGPARRIQSAPARHLGLARPEVYSSP